MQDRRKRILFTRPVAQSLIDRAAQNSIDIQAIPFIQSVPCQPEEISAAISAINKNELVAVFTSVHAVKAVAPFLSQGPLRICCLSGATYGAVQQHFPGSDILAVAENAEALAGKILADGAIKQVTYFCGDLHLPHLPDMLQAAGRRVDLHIVYQTRHTPVAISQHFEGIAFFSPSAVQSYLSLNRIGADTCLFAIGRTTAAALSGPGNRVITSSSPDPDALLDAIIEFYQSGAVPNNTRNA